MIPMIMRIHIVEGNKNKVRLILPLFLVWLLLLPFIILLTPFVLLAALILWPSGYGKTILGAGPALCSVISALSNLHIQVEGPDSKTLIWMK
ncbi:MAG: hypothetical protein JSV17_14295 [Candidatus Aminicenantes bacterium]|nr:MAG: hypothetical protein JSV17_14295 [Candidatus Aminicenantes bacterium]